MKDPPIYYYRARLCIKRDSMPIVFKTGYSAYLYGDTIKKRFRSGLVLTIRIIEPLGTEKPDINNMLAFPHIISEI